MPLSGFLGAGIRHAGTLPRGAGWSCARFEKGPSYPTRHSGVAVLSFLIQRMTIVLTCFKPFTNSIWIAFLNLFRFELGSRLAVLHSCCWLEAGSRSPKSDCVDGVIGISFGTFRAPAFMVFASPTRRRLPVSSSLKMGLTP